SFRTAQSGPGEIGLTRPPDPADFSPVALAFELGRIVCCMSAGCQQANMKKEKTPQSIGEKAYLYLRTRILSGDLPPGTALSEASIARERGNSRGPLREAVRRLTAEGFLRPAPNGGSSVVEFSRRDVAELYELREALEVYAVGKAAEH